MDIFLTRFSSNFEFLKSTYFGDSNHDSPFGLVLDATGDCIFTGFTDSTNYPVFNAFNATDSPFRDAIVTKIKFSNNMLYFQTGLIRGVQ